MIHITDTIALDDHEIQERFVRATGSGGQNVNKEATAPREAAREKRLVAKERHSVVKHSRSGRDDT